MRGRHWLGVATLAVLVAATGLASKPSPASTLSREPVAPIADRLGSAPSDQRDVADVDALNEATTREMWGLPPTRDGSPATFHAASGLELSQDEQSHVDHRIAALEVAGAADSEARSLFPDSYAGSYYERGTGALVVQVVESQAVDASTHLRKTFDPSLVRVNPVRYSLTELSAMEQVAREVIDSRWAGVDRLLGVDNEANRVLVAISEPDIVTRALQAVLPSDGVEVTSLTDAEEQGVGTARTAMRRHQMPAGTNMRGSRTSPSDNGSAEEASTLPKFGSIQHRQAIA